MERQEKHNNKQGRYIDDRNEKRSGGTEICTYIHEVLLHVVRKVLEHSHLAHKVFRNLAGGEHRALAQLCVVMDGPKDMERRRIGVMQLQTQTKMSSHFSVIMAQISNRFQAQQKITNLTLKSLIHFKNTNRFQREAECTKTSLNKHLHYVW